MYYINIPYKGRSSMKNEDLETLIREIIEDTSEEVLTISDDKGKSVACCVWSVHKKEMVLVVILDTEIKFYDKKGSVIETLTINRRED